MIERLKASRRAVQALSSASTVVARGRLALGARGARNRLEVGDGTLLTGMRFDVRGEGNLIRVGDRARLHGVTVTILGSGNQIEIGDEVRIGGPCDLWVEDEGSVLRLGARSTLEHGCVLAALEGQTLTLGEDCMLAADIEIRTGDSHPIADLATPEHPFNGGRSVTLGAHVWVGKRSLVLKGVDLADGVIVGAGSVVAQSIAEPHCVVAGNPARPVRHGVTWRR